MKLPELGPVGQNRNRGKGVTARTRVKLREQKPRREPTWEERFMDEYTPPAWTKNRYVWAAWAVVSVGGVYYSWWVKKGGP